jgi:hypothetical protein
VLKRFDSSGKLLATTPVQAKACPHLDPDAAHQSLMKSSKDRVGWLTNGHEYIEFGLDGRELGRYQPPPGPTPDVFDATLALSEDNEVLVGTRDGEVRKVWWLDREERSWKPVDLPGAKLTPWALLGFDGDRVVVIDGGHPNGATVARYSLSAVK